MGSDWLFLETFSCQVAKNYKFQHIILGKTIKYRYFPKIRQINALKDIFTEAIGRQISGWINHTYRPGKRTPVLTSGNRKGLNKNELFCNTQFFYITIPLLRSLAVISLLLIAGCSQQTGETND